MRIIYRAVCCVLFAVIFLCSPSPGASQDEHRYLDAITEQQPGLVTIAGLELADADAISLVDGANPYIGLRVYPNQPLVNNGKRAEISFNFPYSPGDTIVYEWKIMFPLLFPPSDVPDSRWWSISQWHDQPNINKGETWDNFPAHPPAIAFEYENLNGQDYLGFYHGIFNTERVGLIPLPRGQWLHLRAEIHWSQGEDGSARLFLGDSKAPIFSARGANMFNDYQHYFKIGQYRDPAINSDNTVYFDDVRIYRKQGILLLALPAILGKPSARGNWWRPKPGVSWQWQLPCQEKNQLSSHSAFWAELFSYWAAD